MTPRSRLGTATACLAATLAFALSACGGTPDPDAGATAGPSGEGVLDTSALPTTEPPPGPDYPDTARAYAEAVLHAGDATDIDQLGELSTPEVQEQLIEVPMPIDMTWHYSRCDVAGTDRACVFHNDDGDRMAVTIKSSLLGAAHAAVAVALDMTAFPTVAVTYGRAFADAWLDGNTRRMRRLADDTVANELADDTKPAPNYLACGDGAAGSTFVRIYGGGGPEYVLRISNSSLGHPDAIKQSVTPPNPPACIALILPPTLIIPPTLIFPGG